MNKILLNPPYSQAKTKNLSHLSEISFIKESLEYMKTGGKLAAIIPQSTMIGKTKNDKNYKREILEKHSLETVITLNKDTFYGVGVNPCIAIFTAGIPQDEKKRVNFVNFTDDGYVVRKHIGLVGDGTEKSKKEYLLNVLNDYEDADTNFLVKSPITWEDEWLHSFFYYNEEIPTDEDFEKTIADYLSFEFDMKLHGRGYLFDDKTE
nr:N-6 DNA methylase [Staphylococcus aureus]